MSEPRFYVRSYTGYAGEAGTHSQPRWAITDWYIFDRLYNCRAVRHAQAAEKASGAHHERVAARIQDECERLNREWRLELARG